jgi:sugar-specific transcriptional regulator TrmB
VNQLSVPLISEKTERALRDLGLTEYETIAYLSLLKTGEMTAENVSQTSSIPYTKVYSVLESLENRGWAEHSNGRPRKYFPRSPTDALKAEQLKLESDFDKNRDLIVEELQPLFEKKEIKEIPEIWIIRGEDNSFNKVIDLLNNAKKEIMLAIPWIPRSLLKSNSDFQSLLRQNIQKFMNSDIKIKLLTTKETIKSLHGPELAIAEIRVCDSMFGGGLVVDGRESLIFLDLALPNGPDTSIWSEHETLTSIATIYFEHMWENSQPYKPGI